MTTLLTASMAERAGDDIGVFSDLNKNLLGYAQRLRRPKPVDLGFPSFPDGCKEGLQFYP